MSRALKPDVSLLLGLDPGSDLLERWAKLQGLSSLPLEEARLAVLAHRRVNPGESLEATELLLKSLSKQLEPLERARLLLARAHALRFTGRVVEAQAVYAEVWKRMLDVGAKHEGGKVAIGWVDALTLLGKPKQARKIAQMGRRLLPRNDQLARARLETSLGNAWWSVGRVGEAGRCYADARRRFLAAKQPANAAICSVNLGNVRVREGRIAKAKELYDQAFKTFRRRKQRGLELQARYALASIDLIEGQWQRGMKELESLEGELSGLEDHRAVAVVQKEVAELLAALGAVRPATEYASKAHAGFRGLGLAHEAAHAAFLHARLLASAGRHHDAQVRLNSARMHWLDTGNTWARRRAEMELARSHIRRSDTTAAMKLLRGALAYLDRVDRHGAAAICRGLLAEAHLLEGNAGTAASLAKKAHGQARSYPARLQKPFLSILVARGLLASGNGREGVRWARKSVRELEEILLLFGNRHMDGGIAGSRDALYRQAVDLVLAQGGSTAARTALELIGMARSPTLIEDLMHARGRGMQEELRTTIARLRDELLSAGDPGEDDVRFRSLRTQAKQLENRLEPGSRKGRGPLAKKLLGSSFSSWSRQLGRRQLVLFDRGEAGWRAFVVGPTLRVRWTALPEADRALRESWLPLRMLLETIARTPSDERQEFMTETWEEAASFVEDLNRSLWAPLALADVDTVIVPSGPLHGVPLEALAEAAANEDSAATRKFTRIPHPALLEAMSRRIQRKALVLHGPGSGPRHETEAVGRLLEQSGFEVSRGGRRSLLKDSRTSLGVFHVAAHGAFHRSDWLASGFQLADGWVGYEQLRRRSLRGSLLFLGSCESGLVREIPGSELDGWQAAGLGAGAKELVVTLWKVDDETANDFARAFYRRWVEGMGAAAAAQGAREELRRERSHPFAWAPFVSVG